MIRYIWTRIRRKPQYLIAIFLFSIAIALTLCSLHSSNLAAQDEYDDIYSKIKVRCTVTNLTGTQSDGLDIQTGFISLFTGRRTDDGTAFSDLLEDVQIKASTSILWNGEKYTLVGITSTQISPQLWPENGCTISWNDGFDIGIFDTTEDFCLISQEMEKTLKESGLPTDSISFCIAATNRFETEYSGSLPVVGVYTVQNSKMIYCSWNTYRRILAEMGRTEVADSLFATLRNNDDLERLREVASQYFAQPNPSYAGMSMVDDHNLGFDINDSQLSQAKHNLENSMTVNRIAAILVFALCTAASAFTGFMVVRSRKREIVLMRTMGTSDSRIYAIFALEQMIFVVIGAILGGAVFRWTPVSWLLLFVFVYFVGLSAAVLATLRSNLLTSIKEDE